MASVFVVLVGVVGWGIGHHTSSGSAEPATRRVLPTTTTSTAPTTAASTTTTVPDPGLLPQTRDFPPSNGPLVDAGVQGLWQAIVTDNPSAGMPFFFPLSAYLQVKAISNPALDWQNRLVANYQQDIHHLHSLLGSGAAQAQLVSFDIPSSRAEWIVPGVEYNKIGYWRVYGSTIHYQLDGQSGSFTVTSLISWRGVWYVVHLGTIR